MTQARAHRRPVHPECCPFHRLSLHTSHGDPGGRPCRKQARPGSALGAVIRAQASAASRTPAHVAPDPAHSAASAPAPPRTPPAPRPPPPISIFCDHQPPQGARPPSLVLMKPRRVTDSPEEYAVMPLTCGISKIQRTSKRGRAGADSWTQRMGWSLGGRRGRGRRGLSDYAYNR